VLFDENRLAIADLLLERAASITQLARALDRPKGSVGHHVKVMEEAGLIKVVRTRRVRAIDEKFYGRTARTFLLERMTEAGVSPDIFIRRALTEMSPDKEGGLLTLRYARISEERAREWSQRFAQLVEEFVSQPRSGRHSYGLLVAIYATGRPVLEEEK
jgi:DNA-binding transcriptional ArsR family regulator